MPVVLNEEDNVDLWVYGFGFIRAIDIEKRIFYVLTPLEHNDLKQVNVLARSWNIELPSFFLAAQVIFWIFLEAQVCE